MNATNPPRLDSLDGIARSVARAQEAASLAMATVGDDAICRQMAESAENHSRAALAALEAMGATMPGIETDAPAVAYTVPLHLLNTPVVRRFLDLLEQAADAGAAVDRERGWIDADGGAIGYGEQLAGIVLGVRAEAFGPAGRD